MNLLDPSIVYSVIILGAMGIILGFILAFASKKLEVWEDPRAKKLEEVLPGINCGSCGFTGCSAYAAAIVAGKAELNLCKPGADTALKKLGEIMGKDVTASEPMVAQRYCNGGEKEAKLKHNYTGIQTCKAASLINNGFKQCSYSCLGLGDCSLVCPVNAITMNDNSLPDINKEKCIGCEKCVKECPKSILKMAPKKALVHVRCSSKDAAKVVTKVCTVGCIACKLCEKACQFDAIHVIDNLAVIDYSKCTNCGKCADVCPRKIIIKEPAPVKAPPKKEAVAEAKVEEKK